MKFMGYVILDDNNKILKKFTNSKLSDVVHYIVENNFKTTTEQIKCLYYCKEKETEVLVNI